MIALSLWHVLFSFPVCLERELPCASVGCRGNLLVRDNTRTPFVWPAAYASVRCTRNQSRRGPAARPLLPFAPPGAVIRSAPFSLTRARVSCRPERCDFDPRPLSLRSQRNLPKQIRTELAVALTPDRLQFAVIHKPEINWCGGISTVPTARDSPNEASTWKYIFKLGECVQLHGQRSTFFFSSVYTPYLFYVRRLPKAHDADTIKNYASRRCYCTIKVKNTNRSKPTMASVYYTTPNYNKKVQVRSHTPSHPARFREQARATRAGVWVSVGLCAILYVASNLAPRSKSRRWRRCSHHHTTTHFPQQRRAFRTSYPRFRKK